MGSRRSPARGALGRGAAAALALVLALVALAACGGGSSSDGGRASVVVTTPILGAIVQDVVGDVADVRVLMPNGADPHDFSPSARDVEALTDADLVVRNGLGLEEGLEGGIEEAEREGVPVFTATDHVSLRRVAEERAHAADDDHGDASHEEGEPRHEDEPGHGPEDPHVWMDPLAMRDVVAALAPAAGEAIGADLSAPAARAERSLTALTREIERTLAAVPEGRRRLVTGHDSMGYFADRFGFELVGAIIPSFSSQAEVSAGGLADLKRQVAALGVPAVFTEIGTPADVAEALAGELGVRVVEVPSHTLPDDGAYASFMRGVAGALRDGLAPGAGDGA